MPALAAKADIALARAYSGNIYLASSLVNIASAGQIFAFLIVGLILIRRRSDDWMAILASLMCITTGIGFYALYAYGVIDSLIHYEPVIIRPHDPEYLKQLEKEFELQQKKKAKTTSLRLMPAVGPDHAGLGLSLEF